MILLCVPWGVNLVIEMHKPDSGCKILLEGTMAALNEEALEMLLATTQHSNTLLCIEYAVKRWVMVSRWMIG